MGLRCIIGHDYGDPETTEHREERGNERVVTVEEFRECRRCGHRKVMSENTEVRTIQQSEPEPPATDPNGDTATTENAPDSEYEPAEEETAADDDGVILEDESTEPGREHGEWPDSEDEDAAATDEEETADEWPDDHAEEVRSEPTTDADGWPEHEGEDEGFEAEPSAGGPGEDVDFGGGLAPERTDADETVDTGAESAAEEEVSESGSNEESESVPEQTPSGIHRAETGPTPTAQQRTTAPDAIFECPHCGYTNPASESSLRPGDICPECQRGYLREQAD